MRIVVKTILVLAIFYIAGCRAIRRTVENSQSIEARRMSREGLAAVHQNEWEKAEEFFESALKLSRTDDRAYWGFGEVLWHKGHYGKAIAHLERAVKLSGGDPQYRVRLGTMYLRENRIDEAYQQATKALENGRELAASWALYGDVLTNRDQHEDALAAYHRAISIDNQNGEVQLAIASIYRKQNRFDRLLATVDRVDEHTLPQEQLGSLMVMRGIAMRELGQPENAGQHLQHAIALGIRTPEVFYELALSDFAAGKIAQAELALQESLKIAPEYENSIRLRQNVQQVKARLAEKSSPSEVIKDR